MAPGVDGAIGDFWKETRTMHVVCDARVGRWLVRYDGGHIYVILFESESSVDRVRDEIGEFDAPWQWWRDQIERAGGAGRSVRAQVLDVPTDVLIEAFAKLEANLVTLRKKATKLAASAEFDREQNGKLAKEGNQSGVVVDDGKKASGGDAKL